MGAAKGLAVEPIVLRGIGVARGVVIGPVFLLNPRTPRVAGRAIAESDVEREIIRLEESFIATRRQIRAIQKTMEKGATLADASIFDAHLLVLDDHAFLDEIVSGIRCRRRSAEEMVLEASEQYAKALGALRDEYLRERTADVRDVARRVIRNLQGDEASPFADWTTRRIVVAEDLEPSMTVAMPKDMVLGFATDLGSPTSHTAVMARGLEIPAIVALNDVTARVSNGDEVLIDGTHGILIVHPSPDQLEEYGRVDATRKKIAGGLSRLAKEPAMTRDGRRVVVSANIEGPEELDAVVRYGAEGVGLFRSEFLFLGRGTSVGEDEQALIYDKVAFRLAPDPVIVRTLDLGGDKFLPADQYRKEANPFLGCRSIRLSLRYPDTFKKQLRAILRASAAGNVKIMYPMVSNAREVIQANEILEEAKRELESERVPFQKDIDVGVMIEIPAAALTAEAIADHVDFFSLGTNDLLQYTIAVDRTNERVAYLYEPTHPAVLKLIDLTIKAAHGKGIWVGICGEMAGDPLLSLLLLGMGIDEFSVAPSVVPLVKDAIRSATMEKAEALASTALRCTSAADVAAHCRRLTSELAPELIELV